MDKKCFCGHLLKDHTEYENGINSKGSRFVCTKDGCSKWNLCDIGIDEDDESEFYHRLREVKKEEKEKRVSDFIERVLPKLTKHCSEVGLKLTKLDTYSWRVSNGKDYFDIWQTRTMTTINRKYIKGVNMKGLGLRESNLLFQLSLLIKMKNEQNNGKS